jgi:shikimate 5-dehydrogenase
VGREGEELPVNLAHMPRGSVIVDLVFSTCATPLAAEGRRCGHTVIDGREILLAQASCQYLAMTGENMPQHRALAILGLKANHAPNRPEAKAKATGELLTT